MKSIKKPLHVDRKPLAAAILGGMVAVSAPAIVTATGEANPWAAPKTFAQGQPLMLAQCNPCNPCAVKKACSPCNPCAVKKACSPCNPCAVKKACSPCNPCNPCAVKGAACNPCNPCAVKKNPCNPCNPCKTS